MRNSFLSLVGAEWFLMRKRAAAWITLGIWLLVTALVAYTLPYLALSSGSDAFGLSLEEMLPAELPRNIGVGLPFFGGSLALILGVLSIGSEFGWNTWKTMLTQRPGRLSVYAAKMIALGMMLALFVVLAYVIGAVASVSIAVAEDAAIVWPSIGVLVESLVSGWLILAVWATAGVLLAMLMRGTSLAIGIGILWGLAFEGLLSAFASSIGWLEWLVDFLIRANGYSLVKAIAGGPEVVDGGPGSFSGPYVSGAQATTVLAIYLVVFVGISAWLLHRRDIA